MNNRQFHYSGRVDELAVAAHFTLKDWVKVDAHPWKSLYAWNDSKLYDDFGDQVGKLEANTVYLCHFTTRPIEDLFHELGHAIARKFDLIGYQKNGYCGSWEQRQKRLIAQIEYDRHWSPLLQRICHENQREGITDTPALGSELWAELFMSWFLYPERPEREYIQLELEQLKSTAELASVEKLYLSLSKLD